MTTVLCYDYIVVGAGSAGAVVAARLAEEPELRVLCIEAGTKGDRYFWSLLPTGSAFMIRDEKVNWCYTSEPDPSHGRRPIAVPRGKMLGGSSSINGTIYNRGQAMDYNGWAQAGCQGWGYDDVLPLFKKIESTDAGGDRYRGRSGPLKVTTSQKTAPLFDLLIDAAANAGIPYNPDYSGASQEGIALAQQTAHRGLRKSTATAYLRRAARRQNLTILRGAEVSSLLFEGARCTGVSLMRRGQRQEIRATTEVIVSCGAANTPKLLELSGLGNPEILEPLGLPVRVALRGVGENLREHYAAPMRWSLNRAGVSLAGRGRGLGLVGEALSFGLQRRGFIGQCVAPLRIFMRSGEHLDHPDIMMAVIPFLVEDKGSGLSMSATEGLMIYAHAQRPESAGSVHVRSADPFAPPAITYRFLDTDADRRVAIEAVRQARRIMAAEPMGALVEEELAPGLGLQSDEEILAFLREQGHITHHMIGTCRMGADDGAVVGPDLKVRGVSGLRIADASVMPTMPSGNTSVPCMMIGEKCAEMILAAR